MYPRAKVPTLVGRAARTAPGQSTAAAPQLTRSGSTQSHTGPLVALGEECFSHSSSSSGSGGSTGAPLATSRPVVNGIVQNWGDMAALWRHLFDRHLKARPPYLPSTFVMHVPLTRQ
jgi:hypothetical protein